MMSIAAFSGGNGHYHALEFYNDVQRLLLLRIVCSRHEIQQFVYLTFPIFLLYSLA